MTKQPRFLVLTPAIDGADGVSEASRQAVAALARTFGPTHVAVWTLAACGTVDSRLDGVEIRSADGRRTRLAGWALAEAGAALADVVVLVMHLHLAPLGLVVAMRGGHVAIFLHGIEAWVRLRRREIAALERAASLIANSQVTVGRFRAANPLLAHHPVAVCHLSVPPPVAPAPPRFRGYALIVGRMEAAERYKGHDQLIALWPAICERVEGAQLVIVGDGSDRRRLEAEARRLGLGDRIVFAGRVPAAELAGWYQQAAFFVMPSSAEGFGLAYLEAMAAGKPCIGGRGAAEEIIVDGVTGLIVDAAPASTALRDAMVTLFTDAERRRAMGVAAAARATVAFGTQQFTHRFVDALLGAAASVGR